MKIDFPQDGRFQFKTTFPIFLIFAFQPYQPIGAKKSCCEAQQNKPVELSFAELGMTENQQQAFQRSLSQPQGVNFSNRPPTGSGKSISLYTALQWLNTPDKHIMTAEDPIEIELDGIIQSQINPQIGLDFSRLLRAFFTSRSRHHYAR